MRSIPRRRDQPPAAAPRLVDGQRGAQLPRVVDRRPAGWSRSRSSSSTRRGRVDRRPGYARSFSSPASTATRSRTPRASILRSVSLSSKRARLSTQGLLSEQRCDDMNELDAPLFPAHPPVKITTALHDSCSSELDAAVLARRDERICKVPDVDRAAAAAQRPARRWSRRTGVAQRRVQWL